MGALSLLLSLVMALFVPMFCAGCGVTLRHQAHAWPMIRRETVR